MNTITDDFCEKPWVVSFIGPVSHASVSALRKTLAHLIDAGANGVILDISSDGGSSEAGFTAYNFLRNFPLPLATRNAGEITSIAMMLYLAADTRYTAPDVKFHIHGIYHLPPPGKAYYVYDAYEMFKSLDFSTNRYASIFSERTSGASLPTKIDAHLHGKALIIGANEAINRNIAHRIYQIPKDIAGHLIPDFTR